MRIFAFVVAAGTLSACADLEPLETDVCGNGITEANEDCDGSIDPSLAADGEMLACGEPDGDAVQACRYTCDEASCPVGSRCGSDGVCRAPSGTFERGADLFLSAQDIALRDMDGDGILDLAATSEQRVHVAFGDGTGDFIDVASIGTPPQFQTSVADRQIVGAPALNVVQATDELGLEPVMSGSKASVPFTDGARTLRVDAHGASLSSQLMVIDVDGDTLRIDQLIPNNEQTAAAVSFELPCPPDAQFFFPAVAELDGEIDGTTEELTLARLGDDVVRIMTVADVRSAPRLEVVASISVAALGRVAGRPLLADATGDGLLDLIVPINQSGQDCFGSTFDLGDPCSVAIAPGVGSSSFDPPAIDARFADAIASNFVIHVAADLDNDGDADFVIGPKVFITSPAELTETGSLFGIITVFDSTGLVPPTVALGDVNRDGLVDVVFAREAVFNPFGVIDIAVAINAGRGLFNLVTIDVEGNAFDFPELAVGDFNGDRVDDIAVLLQAIGLNTVSIAFGATAGPPSAFRTVTRQPDLNGITALRTSASSGIEGVAFLGVSATGVRQLFVAAGTSDGQMVELRTLHSEDGLDVFAAERVLADDFDGDGVFDLLALTQNCDAGRCDQTFWLAPGRGNGSYEFPVHEDTDQISDAGDLFLAAYTTGDIDGDDRAEIIGVLGDRRIIVAPGGQAPAVAALQSPRETAAIQSADFDRDGLDDLLVVSAEDQRATYEILWNDSTELVRRAPLQIVQVDNLIGLPIPRPLEIDGDSGLELAYALRDRVAFLEVGEDRELVDLGPVTDPVLGFITSLATGDVNADGVDDIVVLSGSRVFVLLGVPRETLREPAPAL